MSTKYFVLVLYRNMWDVFYEADRTVKFFGIVFIHRSRRAYRSVWWNKKIDEGKRRNEWISESTYASRAWEDMSTMDIDENADTSRRNGNQLGVPSYDWDLSYWQATLANLHWDLAGLSRRPTAFWFPLGLNPWESILLPTMSPCFHATSSPLRTSRSYHCR